MRDGAENKEHHKLGTSLEMWDKIGFHRTSKMVMMVDEGIVE